MITFHMTTDVKDDRRVILTLPPQVPTGRAKLVISVEASASDDDHIPAGTADWVEVQVGQDGSQQARYPLRGSVVSYEQPTEPVAEGDWEALR